MSAFVDDAFYLATYSDVREAGLSPVQHYARFGWREGRDPSPVFSTNGYLQTHGQLAKTGTNPLLHFLETGANPATPDARLADEARLIAPEFDAEFYCRTYRLSDETDPVQHYCRTGWRLGHDPAPTFSTRYYLSDNIDIRESGVNPFWHYLAAGRDEGRSPRHPGGWQYEVIANLQSLDAMKTHWVRNSAPPELQTQDALAARLRAGQKGQATLISFGHDNYLTTPGGVQFCIAMEARRAAERGYDYLNIHPYQPLPTLAARDADPVMSVLLNGDALGHARMSVLTKAIAAAGLPDPRLICHHLMGHAPEQIAALAHALCQTACHFWLHDNFSVCTSYALQRNNVAFCGAPKATSNACTICLYGQERRDQAQRMALFFDALDIDVIAPSQGALSFWQDKSGLAARSTQVMPHLTLHPQPDPAPPTPARELRIAFLGAPLPHKGWPSFERLHAALASDPAYRFWLFSTETTGLDIDRVPIHCTPDNPTAAIDALKDAKIDLVLHWASCRETFSFSTFEAIAAGAFVITNRGSGNVAATVQSTQSGLVLDTEDALMTAACDGTLARLATEARDRRRKQTYAITHSDFTLACLREKAAAA